MKKFKIKETLAIGLPAASLAVSSANLVTNSKKRKENKNFQEKQLEIMNRLTKSLDKVDNTLLESKKQIPVEKKKRGIRFFQKSNSHTSDLAYKYGALGASIGGGASVFLPKKIGGIIKTEKTKDRNGKDITREIFVDNPTFKYPGVKEKYNKLEDSGLRQLLLLVGGTVIGATLGAIAGAVMDISEAVSHKTTVNVRLMKGVLEVLGKSGRTEGEDYTRDPKMANLMKTKVCLVISKSADSLRLLINTVNDPKLKSLSEKIIKNLPSLSTVTEKASDRFNELNITTMTTNKGDATWVASVADRFISAGYPVYLVEVG